ncbi:sugar ABC transporter permease protein [[Mycoplasma] phocae]|uniref:Sugar ABC transporter permease protein n=1 Tax=[Mycoplasma] phocae TaxID=142651 RepID=A0A2Z5IQ27_9BACT|nr:ABC transporter permease [[Mycoplasma] phocae]AXE60903.1 sugar ABC transporter permease protein [[Mycoplasma] phocae]
MSKVTPWTKFKNFLLNEDSVSSRRKVFNSLWAILIGIVIASIFLLFLRVNPIQFFYTIIERSTSSRNINRFLITIAVLIFASIAVGVGFKAGMFNIGVPGQMMASGISSVVVIAYLGRTPGVLVLAIIVGMIVALLTGMIAGILKAYLNINEVVVTILLNWIVFYICWQILSVGSLPFKDPLASLNGQSILLNVASLDTLWFSLIIMFGAIAFAVLMWFILKKTTIGYKIKMTGFNKDASKYSGTNEKKLIITLMSFSAMIAGIAGFLWFVFEEKQMILGSGPVAIGFDSIAISLLAHNAPIGSIFTSIFYSFITIGSASLQTLNVKLDQSTVQIITGIIIYLSAISIVFSKFRVISKLIKLTILIKSKVFFKSTSYLDKYKMQKHQIEKALMSKNLDEKNKKELEKQLISVKRLINLSSNRETMKSNSYYKQIKAKYELEILNKQEYFKKLNVENKNYKINKDLAYLEKEVTIITTFLNNINSGQAHRKIAIYKAYWKTKIYLYIRYRKMQNILKLKNIDNKPKWKELNNQLKEAFIAKGSKRNMTHEEKIALFKELSIKKRAINEQLALIGYFDSKTLKEQYNSQKIEYKNKYSKDVESLVEDFKQRNQWLTMEII